VGLDKRLGDLFINNEIIVVLLHVLGLVFGACNTPPPPPRFPVNHRTGQVANSKAHAGRIEPRLR
jgi:hypothetical protein